MDNIKSASKAIRKAAGPIALSKIISSAVAAYTSSKKRKKGEKNNEEQ